MPLDTKLFRIVTADAYASVPSTDLNCLYDEAVKMTPDTIWMTRAEHGRVLLVAHMLAMAERGASGGGAIKREKVGKLEREYDNFDADQALEMTGYGREFLRLRSYLTSSRFIVC